MVEDIKIGNNQYFFYKTFLKNPKIQLKMISYFKNCLLISPSFLSFNFQNDFEALFIFKSKISD